MKPLDQLTILDLSRVLACPFASMILAELGARVIKVEHPEEGDVTRGWAPPHDPLSGLSAYYLSINRNKESLALDLSTPDGAESVRILSARADVLVENFPPGGLEKFGLSLARLRRENPRLITASITGFGRTGPDASAPGFDLLAQAGAGIMAITGTPESGPTKVGVAVSDLFAGCFTAVGIAAALCGRERTGAGAHVETDLFSSTLASLINVAQSALVTGEEAKPHGNAHPQIVPYRTFSASDGDLVVAAGTDRQFARLAGMLGRPEWAQDPRYRTNEARLGSRVELEASKGSSGASRETRGCRACAKRVSRPAPSAGRSRRCARKRPGPSRRSSFRAASRSCPRRSASRDIPRGSTSRPRSTRTARSCAGSSGCRPLRRGRGRRKTGDGRRETRDIREFACFVYRLPSTVLRLMKIAFIGTHGVGKTTLCFELAALLKKRDRVVEMVREVARFCPLPINRDTTVAAQSWILHTEIAEELAAEGKAEIVICDRSVLDNYCYLLQTGKHPMLEPLVKWWTTSYQLLIKVPIVGSLQFDGLRDVDAAFQRTVDETIDRVLAEWSFPVLRLDQDRRSAWASDSLEAILPLLGPVQQPLFEEGQSP